MRRSSFIVAGLTLTFALVLYLRTLSPRVFLGDSGELAAAGALLDIAHPPGYPLYTLLARLFVAFGAGPIAARVNALSAFAGALSVALFFLLARGGMSVAASLLGALLLGFSSLLWSQAVVAEVYAIHLALFLLALLLLTRSESPRTLALGAWMVGLSAAAHPLGIGLLPILALSHRERPHGWSARSLLSSVLFFLAPLTIFCYLPIRSSLDPPTDWGNPETARAFLAHVLRLGYRDVPKPDLSLALFAGEMSELGRAAARNLPAPLFALVPLGMVPLVRKGGRRLLLPAVGLLLYGPFLALLLRFPLAPDRVDENLVFFLPALVYLLLFLGFGVDLLLAACGERKVVRLGLLATLFVLAFFRLGSAWRTHRYDEVLLPERYARDILEGLPADAVLVARGDDILFPLLYLQRAEGLRRDVSLRDADGIVFPGPGDARPAGRSFTFPEEGLTPSGLVFLERGAEPGRAAEPIDPTPAELLAADESPPLRSLWMNYFETRARSDPEIGRAATARLAALALSGEPVSSDGERARSYAEASILAERGREEEAAARLRSLLAKAPEEILPRLLLAELAMRSGEKEEARRLAEPVSGATAGALTRSAVLFLYLGDEARAEEILEAACRRDRRSPEPLLLLARLAEAKGDTREEMRYERRARAIDPTTVPVAGAGGGRG